MRIIISACLLIATVVSSSGFLLSQEGKGTTVRPDWQHQGILANKNSPYARLHSVPVRAVRLGDGFWSSRMDTNRNQSLPSMLRLLEEHGVVDNFRRLSGRKQAERKGPLYTDSDLYKWMEAAAFVLQSEREDVLKSQLDSMVGEVEAAQGKEGYLNTYYALERENERFTNFRHGHELYCLGHLIQAGIAYYRAAGERRLLNVGIRYADYAISVLGPGKKPALTGHPELEMALVELYRTTGEKSYLEFANYLLNADRPELKLSPEDISYLFSGMPFARRMKFEGHSVRAMYASAGATDYFAETGDKPILETLERLWQDLVKGKMYITGGVGSRESGEAIGEPYELPNEQAYTETCAAIGNAMWNWRMLAVCGEARFADQAERALYNGALSGVSLSGNLYFYRNPLSSLGHTERRPWYSTTCCPPNIQRTLASLPGDFYSTSPEGLWVHLYHNSELDWQLESGCGIKITQQTEYPWGEEINMVVSPQVTSRFSLFLRIPGWCQRAWITINGSTPQSISRPGQYFEVNRTWNSGDRVALRLEMPVTLVEANARVRDDYGRVAVTRGPIVYCLEGIGQPASPFDVSLLVDRKGAVEYRTEFRQDLLGGVMVVWVKALAALKPSSSQSLYQQFSKADISESKPVDVQLIPYYSWANRGPSEMEVWLPWTSR